MIIGFLMQIFYVLIAYVVGLLPTTAFPTAATSAITTVWGYINGLSFLFPVQTLLSVLALAMLFHGTILLWRLLHLVASYIRGR